VALGVALSAPSSTRALNDPVTRSPGFGPKALKLMVPPTVLKRVDWWPLKK